MQKTGWCRGEKAVLVTVYTMKPTRRKASSNRNHHHHHHHHHHHYYHHVHHRPRPHSSVGYDRKAELLLYAQHLRALAHGETTPGHHTNYSNTPEKKLVPVSRKRKYKGSPTCLGDWKKILLPSFVLRSLASFKEKKRRRKKGSESTRSNISAMAQKQGLVKKLRSAFQNEK